MTTPSKNPTNNFELIILILASMFIFGTGCTLFERRSDPLATWTFKPYPHFENPPYGHNANHLDQVIVDDYEGYIKKNNLYPVSAITGFYEDGTGQHAVEFLASYAPAYSRKYVLIYDKENKRIKVIKYGDSHNPC